MVSHAGSIAKIAKRASLEQKEAFISRLHCYWTLKRQSRDGAPLLRSLQLRPMIWNSRVHIHVRPHNTV